MYLVSYVNEKRKSSLCEHLTTIVILYNNKSCMGTGWNINEWFITCIFVLVLITGFFSEIIGQHYIMGPLLLGLAIPEGTPLGTSLIAKMET